MLPAGPLVPLRDLLDEALGGAYVVERELGASPPPAPLGLSDAELSAAIRAGRLDAATPGLIDALIAATCARLAVDNPRYPTLARLGGDAAVQP